MPLVSTYKRREGPATTVLPEGWTEHIAPNGQTYFFNTQTQQSTYARPSYSAPSDPANEHVDGTYPSHELQHQLQSRDYISLTDFGGSQYEVPSFGGNRTVRASQFSRQPFSDRHRRHEPKDRPKHKHRIPGHAPWILVRTKLGRRFVHNLETKESLWRFPAEVYEAVRAIDRADGPRWEKSIENASEGAQMEGSGSPSADGPAVKDGPLREEAEVEQSDKENSSDYTEVEVTDSEAEDSANAEVLSKRQRLGDDQPVEFNEDDFAYQLAAMEGSGDDMDGSFDELGADEDENNNTENNELQVEALDGAFRNLLDDLEVNPYSTFDKVIEEGVILQDDRYLALPNMKSRRECFAAWSRVKIADLKARKDTQEKQDPRVGYLEFLQENASIKLYWPEFKRKYRKDGPMRDNKVNEKEKEHLYREHIKRLGLPSSVQKSDLIVLLKSIPVANLNASSELDMLPHAILTDIRYITLPRKIRDPIIAAYLSTLPPASSESRGPKQDEASSHDRLRQEQAMREREMRVQHDRRKVAKDLSHGKKMLRDGEMELRRAMDHDDRGLRAQLRQPSA